MTRPTEVLAQGLRVLCTPRPGGPGKGWGEAAAPTPLWAASQGLSPKLGTTPAGEECSSSLPSGLFRLLPGDDRPSVDSLRALS